MTPSQRRAAGPEGIAWEIEVFQIWRVPDGKVAAFSGRVDRHRHHRGGDRQLNRALHMIAITRARIDPQTKAYLEHKRSEGKTKREALRSLKRHLARKIHRLLSMPAVDSDPLEFNAAISGRCLT
jgi:Transposase IS116/IS110/IS902 family